MLCPEFGQCGGCSYLDIPYEDELALKQKNVADILAPLGLFGDGFLPEIVPAQNVAGYRNKMEFSFGDTGGDSPLLALGIRKRRRQYEISVPEHCALIPQEFREILLYTLGFFRASAENFYHKKRRTGTLRYLVLRRGEFTGEILVNLVTTSGLQTDLRGWADGLARFAPVGVLHTVSDSRSDAVVPEKVAVLDGRDWFYEKLCGLTFLVSPFSFFQTNSAGAEALYLAVWDALGGADVNRLYDLYCGTGTIAQVLSGCAREIIGVELAEEAVESAQKNARLNGIDNVRFIAADVAKTEICHADYIVVDPPRPGLHPAAMAKLLDARPRGIIYISCKPESLARDLAVLTGAAGAAGFYRVVKRRCHDLFARTPHVETVCVLERNPL